MKIDRLSSEINGMFAERNGETTTLILAALAGEHVLLVGQEAVEDDLLISAVNRCMDDGKPKRYMISSTTAPDEIPVSGSPGFTVLTDVFNASSPAMNAISEMMRDGPKDCRVICGTSRNVPNEDDEMFALYSSFALRETVGPVRDDRAFADGLTAGPARDPQTRLSRSDIMSIRETAASLRMDDSVLSAMLAIREALEKEGKKVSDSRWKKAAGIIGIAAAAIGKDSVDISVIPILQYILWDRPEEKRSIRKLIFRMCTPRSVDMMNLKKDSEELLSQAVESKGAVDENAGFPRVIYCYDCDESFVNLRRLKGHSEAHPRHMYADPNEKESKEHTYMRHGYSDLVTLLTTRYKWDIFKGSSSETIDMFSRETAVLRRRLADLKGTFDSDRAAMMNGLNDNPWLSDDDRIDLIEAFEERDRTVRDIEGIIADTETMMG